MKAIFYLAGLGFVAVVIGAALDWQLVNGQDGAKVNPAVPRPEWIGALNCIGCHGGAGPAFEAYKKEGRTDLCRLDEYAIWNDQDLHGKAYAHIIPKKEDGADKKGNLAWKMQAVLRRDPERGEDYQVHRAVECLTCHAVDQSWTGKQPGKSSRVAPGMQDDEKNPRFVTSHGVSCEACHGFAGEWLGDHVKKSWRTTPPADKAKRGLVDLRSPRVRAERCTSCHVGNQDEGKFVTHEMYAAGHPPLPPFDLAAYSAFAPAHADSHANIAAFKEMEKKWNAKGNDAVDPWAQFHFRSNEVADARNIAIGALVAYRDGIRLLLHDAEAANTEQAKPLMDFAHFDCASCHHELRAKSERFNRNRGLPGRPLLKAPIDLVDAVLEHAEQHQPLKDRAARLRQRIAQLRDSVAAKPFGDPNLIHKHATEVLDALGDDLFNAFEEFVYTREATDKLFDTIATRVRRYAEKGADGRPLRYLDHDAAQQLAWALTTLRGSRAKDNPLDAQVVLTLRRRETMEPKLFRPTPIEERLNERLSLQFSRYRSEGFVAAMLEWLQQTK